MAMNPYNVNLSVDLEKTIEGADLMELASEAASLAAHLKREGEDMDEVMSNPPD